MMPEKKDVETGRKKGSRGRGGLMRMCDRGQESVEREDEEVNENVNKEEEEEGEGITTE